MKTTRYVSIACVVLAFLVAPAAGLALAGEKAEARTVAGEITAWDAAQKQFELATEEGKQLRLQWNEKTRIEGEPQVGAAVEVTFHMSEGTLVATHIRVL